MGPYLLSFVVLVVCVANLRADSTGACPADLASLMAEVKTLRHEIKEGFSKRDNEITALREQMAEDAVTAGAAVAAAASAASAQAAALEDTLTAIENDLKLEKMMTGSLKQKMAELQAIPTPRHSQEEDQIAFSVYSEDNFGPNSVYTNIPFPLVRTNIGGAWMPHINSFQAARAGVYLFSASMRGSTDGSNSYGAIAHTTTSGSERTVNLYSKGDVNMGDANVVILEVGVGDYVSVQLNGGEIGSAANQIYSTFSGFFLF